MDRDDSEATPARRLIAFAVTFLGLLAFSNRNFVDGAVIAPPIALAIVLCAAIGGLMIWIDLRWSRTMFWAGATLAVLATGAAAMRAGPSGLLRIAVPLAMLATAIAATAQATIARWPHVVPARLHRAAGWTAIGGLVCLALTTPGAGEAAVLPLTVALALAALAWLLRPVAAAPA